MKNLELIYKFTKLGVIERLESIGAGIFMIIGLILKVLLVFVFFDIIYSYVDQIAGWSKYEVFVLLGVFNLLETIGWATYIRGFNRIPREILTGKMDIFLTKPVNLRLFIASRRIDLLYPLPTILTSFLILLYGIHGLEYFYIWNFLFFLTLAFIVHFSFFSILYSSNFIKLQRSSLQLGSSLVNLGKYPISIYKGGLKLILSTIIPVGIMFSLPAQMMTEKLSLIKTVQVVAFVILFYIISKLFWNYSIKFYESANG